jgi:SAM-dependent methyltransferase
MNLSDWQKNWNELGKDDPLWVVLTESSKKGGRWDPVEFFDLGVKEITQVLAEAATLNVPLRKGRALDFGCGVGRLSQALAMHFDQVHGVDISPSMVGHANRLSRFPEKCQYHINAEEHLGLFPDNHFDFVYSNITLQHIEQRFAKAYIADFLRVAKPGGIIVFQVLNPAFPRSLVPEFLVRMWRRLKHRGKPYIGIFGFRDGEIDSLCEANGGKILRIEKTNSDDSRWLSRRYFVTK